MSASPFAAFRAERSRVDGVLAWFAWFVDQAWARRAIVAVNVGGIAYGFWYYRQQFAVTPWWFWPFVPDSPLAVLWATLALLLVELNRRSPLLEGFAFVGNVVVGLWTAFVLTFYDRVNPGRLDFVLFWLHLAMIALALLFVKGLRDGSPRRAWVAVGGAGAYYLANALVDYWYTGFRFQGCAGLHPISIHMPGDPCGGLDVVGWVTMGLTVGAVGALGLLTLRRAKTS